MRIALLQRMVWSAGQVEKRKFAEEFSRFDQMRTRVV